MKRFALLFSTLAITTVAAAQTIQELVRTNENLSLFVALVQSAGLEDMLGDADPLTVFAPSNQALGALPPGAVREFLRPENRDSLRAVLTYHIVGGSLDAAAVSRSRFLSTLNGQRLPVSLVSGGVRVDGVEITRPDMRARNGTLHIIDGLLSPASLNLPELAASAGTFATLLQAVQVAELGDALAGDGPMTLFAPSDEAFRHLPVGTVDALLQPANRTQLIALLQYHLVLGRQYSDALVSTGRLESLNGGFLDAGLAGGRLEVNGIGIVETDLEASNGVIHVIDAVLQPPNFALMAATELPANVLRGAINRGAPLFNQGQIEACAAIYEAAVAGLLTSDDLPVEAAAPLREALAEARRLDAARDRAWALRRGMDMALLVLDR